MRYLGLAVAAAAAAIVVGAPAHAAGTRPVAFVRSGSIYLLSGTTAVRLTRDADDTRPRWSPDGRRLAYGHAGALSVINADGTGTRALTSYPTSGAAWSSDGDSLAFEAPGCPGLPGVFELPAAGGP